MLLLYTATLDRVSITFYIPLLIGTALLRRSWEVVYAPDKPVIWDRCCVSAVEVSCSRWEHWLVHGLHRGPVQPYDFKPANHNVTVETPKQQDPNASLDHSPHCQRIYRLLLCLGHDSCLWDTLSLRSYISRRCFQRLPGFSPMPKLTCNSQMMWLLITSLTAGLLNTPGILPWGHCPTSLILYLKHSPTLSSSPSATCTPAQQDS